MFERLVGQLLVGYLGRYVKDIQKEKLKITFWNASAVGLQSSRIDANTSLCSYKMILGMYDPWLSGMRSLDKWVAAFLLY
ncbi:hypothetical protein SDJN02_14799, partial [Cucurbita argyrosperma subsp. argyrosperma]